MIETLKVPSGDDVVSTDGSAVIVVPSGEAQGPIPTRHNVGDIIIVGGVRLRIDQSIYLTEVVP